MITSHVDVIAIVLERDVGVPTMPREIKIYSDSQSTAERSAVDLC